MAVIGITLKGKYENEDALEKLCTYIFNPVKSPLNYRYVLGVPGIYEDITECVVQINNAFNRIKLNYNQPTGRQAYHFWYSFSTKEAKKLNYENIYAIMTLFCNHIYNCGYQVIASIHVGDENGNSKLPHIHFAFNSVNYLTGTKNRGNLLKELLDFANENIYPIYKINTNCAY